MKSPAENNDYYRNYKLVRDPFPLDSTDQVLYLTPELNRRLELLANRVATGCPVQLIIAPAGGGKTVIADYLASLKESNWLASMIRAEPHMDGDSLSLALVTRYFPEGDIEREQAMGRLQQLLESSELNGKLPVFIIDDAHLLSQDCLQFFLQLTRDSACCVILFGNEAINDLLEQPELEALTKERLQRLYLPPLSPEQTRAYIDNRLSLSGEANAYPFSDDELHQIARISAGLPGGINLLARQFMQQKTSGRAVSKGGSGKLLIAVISVLVVLAAAYYFLIYRQMNASTKKTTAPIAAVPEKPEQPVPVAKQQAGPVAKAATEEKLFNAQVSLKLPTATTATAAETEKSGPHLAVSDSAPPAQDSTTQTPVATEPATAGQQLSEPEQDSSSVVAAEFTGSDEAAPAAPERMADDNVYRLDPVPAIVQGIKGPAWLRQQSPDLYVLQILSVSDFNNLVRMLKKIPEIQGQLSGYTNYTPSGKPRYLLYYGLYPDKDTAYAAIKDIPTTLQAIKPWPRSLKSLLAQLDELQARGYY